MLQIPEWEQPDTTINSSFAMIASAESSLIKSSLPFSSTNGVICDSNELSLGISPKNIMFSDIWYGSFDVIILNLFF